MVHPPVVRFPDPVRDDLNAHRPGLADATEQLFAAHVRPCIAVTAKRVSESPMYRSRLTRMFGARVSAPVLGPLASKFGGVPYCEEPEDWRDHLFLGQIDLAQATSVLPPTAPRLTGLLRIDQPHRGRFDMLRVKWFRTPSAQRAVPVHAASVGSWETRLEFKLSWTLPEGNALEALWPHRDLRWFEYEPFDYPDGFNTDAFDEFHRMLGHKSAGLDEHYGFTAPPGCSGDIAEYECLLRLTYDNAAGFAWGTNWVYVLVPAKDLARGDLGRLVVAGANA